MPLLLPTPSQELFLYAEKIDIQNKSMLFDCFESNTFSLLASIDPVITDQKGPSMILFKNYKFRKREGSIYILKLEQLLRLYTSGRVSLVNDSMLILLEIDCKEEGIDVLEKSNGRKHVMNTHFKFLETEIEGNTSSEISLPNSGKCCLIVKDVGQGSWNEVIVNDQVVAVFDIGTHHSVSTNKLNEIIGDRELVYQKDKPILVISHWDVDHYHLLKILSVETLNSFAAIICRNSPCSLTSRLIMNKLLENNNCYITLPAIDKKNLPKKIHFVEYFSNNRFVILNSKWNTNRNMDGICFLLKTSAQSVLCSADFHYRQFDESIKQKYLNYIHIHHFVVPHHGGNAGRYINTLSHNIARGQAIISVGVNQYGHPFEKYINDIRKDRYNIRRTDYSGEILLNL